MDGEGSDLRLRDGGVLLARHWRGSLRRMWRFGCSRRATSRSTARICEFRTSPSRRLRADACLSGGGAGGARDGGLARFGTLSVDGTKRCRWRIRGGRSSNAQAAMSYGRMWRGSCRRMRLGSAAGGDRGLLERAGAKVDERRGGDRTLDAEEDDVGARISAATSCPRSCNAGRSAWRRCRQPKRVWRRRNAGATLSAGASLGRAAIPGAGGPTSGPTASPRRRRRAISPIPRARS